MDESISLAIHEIIDMAIAISKNSPADVFFRYSPHVNSFAVTIWLNGWDIRGEKSRHYDVPLNSPHALESLKELQSSLTGLRATQLN